MGLPYVPTLGWFERSMYAYMTDMECLGYINFQFQTGWIGHGRCTDEQPFADVSGSFFLLMLAFVTLDHLQEPAGHLFVGNWRNQTPLHKN